MRYRSFQKVNDTYGHQVGDDAFCGLVQRIKDNLREYDRVGRYGGEEFLVITPVLEGDEQKALFERLLSSVATQQFATRAGDIAIMVSIGVAKGNGMSSVDEMLASPTPPCTEQKMQDVTESFTPTESFKA